MTTTAADTLRAARALVARGWCQGAFARTVDGRITAIDCGECFCTVGALLHVLPNPGASGYATACEALARALPAGFEHLPTYNDFETTRQADVLSLYDRAIALAESEVAT